MNLATRSFVCTCLGVVIRIEGFFNTVACRAVSRQRLGKHVPAATHTHATIEVLFETFSTVVRAEGL
jgi:hypothetical protein